MPPDGITPTSMVSIPADWKPACSARDSISPERLRVPADYHRPHRQLQTGGPADGDRQFGSELEIGDSPDPIRPEQTMPRPDQRPQLGAVSHGGAVVRGAWCVVRRKQGVC